MSASAVRIEANRANAGLSTGPRTPEGKAVSSHNAVKDGLTAAGIFVRDEKEAAEFQSLRAHLRHEVKPHGEIEQTIFDMLVHAAWNLHRIRKLQASLQSESSDPLLDDSLDQRLERLERHHTKSERTWFRCLRELERMQSNRISRAEALSPEADRQTPVLVSIEQIAKQTQRFGAASQIRNWIAESAVRDEILRSCYPSETPPTSSLEAASIDSTAAWR